jgi:hypothetical protein
MASSVLTDVAGNNFAGINNSSTWAFNAASLSTTVAWSGANVNDNITRSFGNGFTKCCGKIAIWRYRAYSLLILYQPLKLLMEKSLLMLPNQT